MPFIEWDKNMYSVGMTKMDEQHKVLVGLLNALHERKNDPSREFVQRILNTLVEYTQNHFRDEELILEKINFTNFKKHRQQHERFVEKVRGMADEVTNSENIVEQVDELLLFLRQWLMNHILIEDMAYKNYLFGSD